MLYPACTLTPDVVQERKAPLAPQMSSHAGLVNDSRDLPVPLWAGVGCHSLNCALDTPANMRCFMEYLFFAMYNFMSLIKRSQKDLTCLDIPWLPPNPDCAGLIDEIQSSCDGRGQPLASEINNKAILFRIYHT